MPSDETGLGRVAVALDTDQRDVFEGWCKFFGPRVGALKVGLEAYGRWGVDAVAIARRSAHRLFLDLKLHDIPTTVAGAVRAARDHGADLLTVHAGGGPKMLAAASAAAGRDLGIVAVTVLTHLDTAELDALALPGPPTERARRWAALARTSGCAGVVCSPQEVAALRSEHPRPFELITPGIRPEGSAADDQRRTATPASAIASGADLLVIGRPLTRANDPEAALRALAAELSGVATSDG